MELLLQREPTTGRNTLGILSIDGAHFWHTLEDIVREVTDQPVEQWKVKGATAIPSGRYLVHKTFSPKYGRLMYLVDGVPGFSGIRIHSGNDAGDTEGCILLGMKRGNLDGDPEPEIMQSRLAVAELEKMLDWATEHGEQIHLTIRNA